MTEISFPTSGVVLSIIELAENLTEIKQLLEPNSQLRVLIKIKPTRCFSKDSHRKEIRAAPRKNISSFGERISCKFLVEENLWQLSLTLSNIIWFEKKYSTMLGKTIKTFQSVKEFEETWLKTPIQIHEQEMEALVSGFIEQNPSHSNSHHTRPRARSQIKKKQKVQEIHQVEDIANRSDIKAILGRSGDGSCVSQHKSLAGLDYTGKEFVFLSTDARGLMFNRMNKEFEKKDFNILSAIKTSPKEVKEKTKQMSFFSTASGIYQRNGEYEKKDIC